MDWAKNVVKEVIDAKESVILDNATLETSLAWDSISKNKPKPSSCFRC